MKYCPRDAGRRRERTKRRLRRGILSQGGQEGKAHVTKREEGRQKSRGLSGTSPHDYILTSCFRSRREKSRLKRNTDPVVSLSVGKRLNHLKENYKTGEKFFKRIGERGRGNTPLVTLDPGVYSELRKGCIPPNGVRQYAGRSKKRRSQLRWVRGLKHNRKESFNRAPKHFWEKENCISILPNPPGGDQTRGKNGKDPVSLTFWLLFKLWFSVG